jgi:hypothetical protein
MDKRIIIGKVMHSGKELECYVPQIFINKKWRNVLSKGSYILKEGLNANEICSKCGGEGCIECNKVGLKRAIPKDNKYIAEFFLEKAVNEYNVALKTLNSIRHQKESEPHP